MKQMAPRQIFDKKFVAAACLIGAGYTAIIVFISWLVGKESAAVAGVALTALATAIFRQFETLRFKTLADSAGAVVIVPRLSASKIVLVCFSLTGATFMIIGMLGDIGVHLGIAPPLDRFEDFQLLLSDWRVYSILFGVKVLIFFFVGYLITKAFHVCLYSDIAVGALLAIASPALIPIIDIAITEPGQLRLLHFGGASPLLVTAVFWLAFVASAVVGALLGVRSRLLQASSDEAQPCNPPDIARKPRNAGDFERYAPKTEGYRTKNE